MKAMLRPSLFIFPILFTLFSCIKTVENKDMPEPANLLVIGGFISPSDSIIKIHVEKTVSTSSSLNMAGGDTVENATVILSGDGLSATLAYDEVYRSYVTPLTNSRLLSAIHTFFLFQHQTAFQQPVKLQCHYRRIQVWIILLIQMDHEF